MQPPLVITVILNTNRKADTLAALESLAGSDYSPQHVIVLDNASQDGSVEAIRAAFPDVKIILLEQNLGYAGNNNVGVQAALEQGADWVLVLNEDTVMAPDCLSRLVAVGEADPGVGVLGPMVYHFDEPQVIQTAGGTLDSSWLASHLAQNVADTGQFIQPHAVDFVSGCAILVRRAVIEQVGALDARFFYYWEETEWCLRAREAGWTVLQVPLAKLWHKGVRRDYQPGPSVTYYGIRNRFLMMSKHHAPLQAWLIAWEQTLRRLASWSLNPRWRSMRPHRDALWQGVVDFLHKRWGMRSI